MKNILEYLEQSAQRTPQKAAFIDTKRTYTYGELEAAARRLGSFLAKELPVHSPVPVFMDKSVEAIVAFLGSVYAGCFYVMVDSGHPIGRVKRILDTLEPKVLLTDKKHEKQARELGFSGKILILEECLESQEDSCLLRQIRRQSKDTDPLYGMFTSGSTGTPKGVVTAHRGVIDFIDSFTELFEITGEDILGNQAPFDFDVSVKDIYSTLKTGATMVLIPKQFFSFPTKLLDYISWHRVTTLIWAVSALCMVSALKGLEYKTPSAVNKILFSGEAMPVKQLNIWKKHLPDAMYVNLYGPTEVTCNCCYYKIDREFAPGEVIPMGNTFPDEQVFLLDEEGRLVTPDQEGVKGEICVSGTGLALGYYNAPEQTAERFVQNPLQSEAPQRVYLTGDLGYYNDRGELCYAARRDNQIKHMGHRIELGEIEVSMEELEPVERACCIFDAERGRIIGFYQGNIHERQIRQELGKRLPAYMLPHKWMAVTRMPVTANGKVDRRELENYYLEECHVSNRQAG